ncbi:hypothetical protein GCM10010329_62880 [Streptomyces spiroverticillatus]|nr:hypothetical protein GCM10010329_62880 [Streptomyces spiroverticillatus]
MVLAVRLRYVEEKSVSTVLLVVSLVTAVAGFLPPRPAAPKELEAVAQELAADVRREWGAEAARNVVASSVLPVAWRSADPELVEGWEEVVGAARGLPEGPPGEADTWPTDATGLAGTYTEIGEIFTRRVPTRRLVVLGGPGSGKTALLVRLLQELGRPPAGGPVPVLLSLASWDPRAPGGLRAWLAEQLRRHNNVDLRHPAGAEARTPDRAQALVDRGLVLPLLDGFDEIPPALQALALHEINSAWRTRPLVLTSRTDAYRAALGGPEARLLDGATGIQLIPLTAGPAASYLRQGLPPARAARWDAVVARLGSQTPVGQVLATPLGLYLARTVYVRPPGTRETGPVPHPDDLCDTTALPTQEELERHLFRHFLTAVYDETAPHTGPHRWSAEQARRTCTALARHLETHHGGSPDLAWWELGPMVPAERRENVAALLTGLPSGALVGLVVTLGLGWGWGLVGLLAAFLTSGIASATVRPGAAAVAYPSTRFRSTLYFGLLLALLATLVVNEIAEGWVVQYGSLLAAAVLWSRLNGSLTLERADPSTAVGPRKLLVQDRRIFLQIVLLYAMAFGAWGVFVCGLKGLFWGIPPFGIAGGLAVGLTAGLARGLTLGLRDTSWAQFAVTTVCLAVRRQAPWSLMAFLRDAHARGVLRQVGTVYQFRHIGLQRHLAGQVPRGGA